MKTNALSSITTKDYVYAVANRKDDGSHHLLLQNMCYSNHIYKIIDIVGEDEIIAGERVHL